MKTMHLAILCLIATASLLCAQSGTGSIEKAITGSNWNVNTELGNRAWGDIRFRDGHEFATMNGPQGAWKVTGERTVELGSMYVVEFAPGLESFVATLKAGGAKVAVGKLARTKAGTTSPAAPPPPPVGSAPKPKIPPTPPTPSTPDPLNLRSTDHVPERPMAPAKVAPSVVAQMVKPVPPAKKPGPAFPGSLGDTLWEWRNADDYVQTGGVSVIKQGAWQEVRFRHNGKATAWHGNRIVWEGKWEVVGERTIKLATGGPIGVVAHFSEEVSTCKVSNERDTTGRKKGYAYLDPVVGRWHWGRDVRDVREDGTAGKDGIWTRLPDGRYEFNWAGGAWIDKLTLTQDGKRLHGTNQKKHKVSVERVNE